MKSLEEKLWGMKADLGEIKILIRLMFFEVFVVYNLFMAAVFLVDLWFREGSLKVFPSNYIFWILISSTAQLIALIRLITLHSASEEKEAS